MTDELRRQHVILLTPDEGYRGEPSGWVLTVPTRPTVKVIAHTIGDALRDLADAWVDAEPPAESELRHPEQPPLTPVPAPVRPDPEAWRRLMGKQAAP